MICNGCQGSYQPRAKQDPTDNLWLCPNCNKKMKDPKDNTASLKSFKEWHKQLKEKSTKKSK
ncbi:hypothetical protein LCGC14_0380430 [marine sediment metagenome]|uniref:Uncharacterized protein n=1 Tax=marine sediment metagenome TaxID=412755 RepID=A0A0F9TKL5_9ZZZZ